MTALPARPCSQESRDGNRAGTASHVDGRQAGLWRLGVGKMWDSIKPSTVAASAIVFSAFDVCAIPSGPCYHAEVKNPQRDEETLQGVGDGQGVAQARAALPT